MYMQQHFFSENKAYKHWTDVSLQLTPYNQYFIKSYDYRYIFVPCRSYKGQVHLFIIRLKGEKNHALLNFTKSKYVCKSPMYMSSTSPVILRSRVTTSAILFKLKKRKEKKRKKKGVVPSELIEEQHIIYPYI